MADNTTLNAGSGGDAVRAIDKAGAKTQVVTLDLGGSGAESLPSGTLPVSGTVALDSASLTALETVSIANFPATQPVSGTVAVSGTVPVSGTFWQATQPVSGTFWQATQPVSGTVAVSNFPASQAVTGTFWQATQPVSLASLPALTAGTSAIGRTTDTAQTGRVLFAINYNATNAAAADTLLTTLVVNRAGVATTGQTSVAVTSGKTLRLTGAVLTVRTTTAALPWGLLTIRMNPSGAAVIGSPVVCQVATAGTAATAGNTGAVNLCFDVGGLEFSGTQQIGLSYANNVNTNVTAVTLYGYEYTTPS